jgi:hypothetical protein
MAAYGGLAGSYAGDEIIGEEVVQIPVRVPIRVRRSVAQVPVPVQTAQIQYVPQIQYIEKIVEGPKSVEVKYVEKEAEIIEKRVTVYACNACGRDIHGNMLEKPNGKFHHDCYIECDGCGRWIQFNSFQAMGKTWHRECFTCFACGRSCASGYILHNGRAAHEGCVQQQTVTKKAAGGMAAKREIKAKTFEEAVKYDEMGNGAPDGKYNGITIVCDDPRWAQRAREKGYDQAATWECSDADTADRYKGAAGKVVVSHDGNVDGNV